MLKKHRNLLVLVLLIFFSNLIIQVESRGKKKKSGSGSTASCSSKGLDCSATCCLDSTCAIDLADCAGYTNRDLTELYTGFGALIALMIGIPILISGLNICVI